MERLSSAALRSFAIIVEELGSPCDPGLFPHVVMSAVRRLVSCDSVSYNLIDLRSHENAFFWEPEEALDARHLPSFERTIGEHPVLAHQMRTRDGTAAKISDFLGQREFHRLGLYADAYRLVRVEHQMAISILLGAGALLGLAVNRGHRDFGEGERALLDLLRPFIAQAYRHDQALDLLRRGISDDRRELVLIDRTGKIVSVTDRGRSWLADYAGADGRTADYLPEPLFSWVRQALWRRFDEEPEPEPPFVINRENRTLVVRVTRGGIGSAYDLVLLEERLVASVVPSFAEFGLTPRERQVLAEVAAGKSNQEIGHVLNISERTVEKHMAHVHLKLGVRSRTAVVRLAVGAAGGM